MSRKVLAGPAGDRTPAEVASDADCELQNRRNHNDAFGLVEQILRNPVGNVQNFLEHLATSFEALLFPALIRCESGTRQKNGDNKNADLPHGTAPKHLLDSRVIRVTRRPPWWRSCAK